LVLEDPRGQGLSSRTTTLDDRVPRTALPIHFFGEYRLLYSYSLLQTVDDRIDGAAGETDPLGDWDDGLRQ